MQKVNKYPFSRNARQEEKISFVFNLDGYWFRSVFYISISLYRHLDIISPSCIYPFDIEMTVK